MDFDVDSVKINQYFISLFSLDASPELVYWFSEQTLQPGPTVSLKCVATGNPPVRPFTYIFVIFFMINLHFILYNLSVAT